MVPAQMVTFRLADNLASWIVTVWAAFFLLRHTPLTLPHCRVLAARLDVLRWEGFCPTQGLCGAWLFVQSFPVFH